MCREKLPVVVRWAGVHMRQQFPVQPVYSTCISGGWFFWPSCCCDPRVAIGVLHFSLSITVLVLSYSIPLLLHFAESSPTELQLVPPILVDDDGLEAICWCPARAS